MSCGCPSTHTRSFQQAVARLAKSNRGPTGDPRCQIACQDRISPALGPREHDGCKCAKESVQRSCQEPIMASTILTFTRTWAPSHTLCPPKHSLAAPPRSETHPTLFEEETIVQLQSFRSEGWLAEDVLRQTQALQGGEDKAQRPRPMPCAMKV